MAEVKFTNEDRHQNMWLKRPVKTGGAVSLRTAATALTTTYVASSSVDVMPYKSGQFNFTWGTKGDATTFEIRADVSDDGTTWFSVPDGIAAASDVSKMEPLTIQLTASEMDTTVGFALRHDAIDRAIRASSKIRLRVKETGSSDTAPTCGIEFQGGI